MSLTKKIIKCGICTHVWLITYIANAPLENVVCPTCGHKGYAEFIEETDEDIFE